MHIPSVGDVPDIMRRRFWKSNCGSVLHSGRDSGTVLSIALSVARLILLRRNSAAEVGSRP